MYWPKFSEKTFYRKIDKARKLPCGVTTSYLQWTKYVGLKLFFDRSSMEAARRRQKKAADYGLAPRVGGVVKIQVYSWERDDQSCWSDSDAPIPRKRTLYCYFTETATKIGRQVSMKKLLKLEDDLFDIRIFHADLHLHNVGYVGKKLVCIDFDDISCS